MSKALAQMADRIRPLRRVEYDQLVQTGQLANEKVELLRGLIVRMSPQGPRHAAAVQRLSKIFMAAVAIPGLADVRIQLPLALAEDSEPEPDLAVVPTGAYKQAHPTRAHLFIEVAETSLATDRHDKGTLYAENGVPEYCIVDAASERVEVHSEPVDGVYTRVTPFRSGEIVASSALPALRVPVDDVFA